MTPTLSILICTVPSRGHQLSGLIYQLNKQVEAVGDTEIIYLGDNKRWSVGRKRNHLITLASGEYIVFVDDDDRVAPNYVQKILTAAHEEKDVVCFDVEISENGEPYKKVIYDTAFEMDANFSDHFERWPNHLMPIRRELIHADIFPDVSTGEDFAYAKTIRKRIKTQARIPETLYFYDYNILMSETPRRSR